MTLQDLGQVDEQDSSQFHTNKLRSKWETRKDVCKYPLFWALYDCYKWQVLITMLAFWTNILLETINIHILREVMAYIDGESNDQNKAVMFVVIMTAFEL